MCPGKGLCGTFGPGIIPQNDNCQNPLDDHVNGQHSDENGGKHPFSTGKGLVVDEGEEFRSVTAVRK